MERLKVFVSSTWTDLQPEREAVERALHRLGGVSFKGMEYFGSRPETPKETCLAEVANSDLYLGIFAHRYGSIDPETGLSMTELEYRKAEELGKPSYIYLKSDEVPVRPGYIERSEEGRQKSKALKERLTGTRTLSFFVSPDDLALRVIIDLYHHFSRKLVSPVPVPQSEIEQFAQWVRDWLAVTNYVIKDFQIRDTRQADVIAELRVKIGARKLVQRIMVRCIYREISAADVQEIQTELAESTEFTDGWLVSPRRVSQVARDESAKQDNLAVYTFDELIDEHANWDKYFTWLEEEVKRRGVDRYYVDLSCTKDDIDPETKKKLGTSRYECIDDHIGQWLDDPAKEHISVLGEFGTGKTWFCLHYAHETTQAYKAAREAGRQRPRLPVLIPLRDYAKAVSVEMLFSEFFFRKHEIGLPGYRAFEQLNRIGKLLLIFDGFDEMADKINRQKQIDNFWELAQVVVPKAKAILTCRTEHFEFAKAAVKTFWGEEPPTTSATAKILLEPPRFEVLNLEKLSPKQIKQIIIKREGKERGSALAERILENVELTDLAGRVASIELIIAALPTLNAGGKIDLSRVYLHASNKLLLKNIREKRSFTSMADKLHFLCEMAWEMLSASELKIKFTEFPDRLRQYRPELKRREIDHWKYDLEGQTLLVRDDDGNYAFSHKALAEFFVAYKFAAELGAFSPDSEWIRRYFPLREKFTKDQPVRVWHDFFKCPYVDEECPYRMVEKNGTTYCCRPAGTCISAFAQEPLGRLAGTFGLRPLTPEILGFLAAMVEKTESLWTLIKATAKRKPDAVGYIGGNAATILRRKGESFKGAKLAYTMLTNADLFNADLTSADLHGANLCEANLSGCTLENADFRGANLTGVRIQEMGEVFSTAWSPDGRYLASGGLDGNVRIWSTRTWLEAAVLHSDAQVWKISWSPDGTYLVSSHEGGLAILWDMQSLQPQSTFREAHSGFTCTSFDPNGKYVAVGSEAGMVSLWDIDKKRAIHFQQRGDPVWALEWIPNGQYIAVGLLLSDTIRILDITTCQWVSEFKSRIHGIRSIAFSPEGNYMLLGGGGGAIEIIEMSTGKRKVEQLHNVAVWDVCFSPNEESFATAGWDGIARIWRGPKRTILEHTDKVNSVSFSPNGYYLATGSDDANIRIWNVETAKCAKVLEVKMNCRGMQIGSAKGLNAPAPYGKGTLGGWLTAHGAVE